MLRFRKVINNIVYTETMAYDQASGYQVSNPTKKWNIQQKVRQSKMLVGKVADGSQFDHIFRINLSIWKEQDCSKERTTLQ